MQLIRFFARVGEHLKKLFAPLRTLMPSPNPEVVAWATGMLKQLQISIDADEKREQDWEKANSETFE